MSSEPKSTAGEKICITSQGVNLDSQVDQRFGRCQYFLIIDTATLKFEVIKNPNVEAMGGAGVRSGQFISERQVKAVLTGNVGPNAFQTLKSAGIKVITGVSGTVSEAIKKYNKSRFKHTQTPSVSSKFGMPSKEK